jgi:hypothetical protein
MGTCAKLTPHYCGPFEVLERVGPITYILTLPPSIKDHNVFHVSLLNNHEPNHVIDWTIIHVELEGKFHLEPQYILDKRETMHQNRAIMHVKMQWKNFGVDEVTWEREDDMRVTYPFFFLYNCIYMVF